MCDRHCSSEEIANNSEIRLLNASAAQPTLLLMLKERFGERMQNDQTKWTDVLLKYFEQNLLN